MSVQWPGQDMSAGHTGHPPDLRAHPDTAVTSLRQVPVAAGTRSHTLNGLKQSKFILPHFWRSEV